MEPNDFFEYLMISGIVEFSGMDTETNEMLYNFTGDLEDIDPELFMKVAEMINEDIYILWQKGFLDMDVTQVNPKVSLAEKALDSEVVSKELNRDEQRSLSVIKLYMSK